MKISRGRFLASLIGLPLVAKAVLVRRSGPVVETRGVDVQVRNGLTQIQSRNYEAGETGFVIRPDGTAEFNCANVRWEQPAGGWDRVSNWPEWEAESRRAGARFEAEVVETINADVRAALSRMPVQKVDGVIEFRSMARMKEVVGPGYRITHVEGFGPF